MTVATQGKTSTTGVPKALLASKEPEPPPSESAAQGHRLDAEEWQARLKKLVTWRRQARAAQSDNRREMAIDEDFYDGIQLDAQDLKILNDRNQPPQVFNVTKNTINWILGTERKTRIDYRVLPRTKKGAQAAKGKTKLLKYIQDMSKGEYERSFAFTEQVIAGLGWLEIGARRSGDSKVFMRAERWRNMWFDHLGLSLDGSDWRYVIREKWIDLDVAEALFPERASSLKTLAEGVNSLYPFRPEDITVTDDASEFDTESELDAMLGGAFSGARERVKAIEMWYRIPANVKVMRARGTDTPYGALDGAIFRPEHADHQYLVRGNYFSLSDEYRMTVRCAIWAGSTYLQDMLTPYNHDRFPFVPLFCYRRKRDNMPYGAVRDLRDPQSDLNKRKSRSLVLLTANKVWFETGAVNDPQKFYEENNRPDGMAEVNAGALTGPKIKKIDETQLAQHHIELGRDDERFIESVSGVTPENQGTVRRDLSGKAIEALQLQGHTTAGVYFDNYFYAFQIVGEMLVRLEEQFYDEDEEIRITGDQQNDEFIRINHRLADGTVENPILDSKADFIVSKQDYRESMRVAMLQMLSELVQGLATAGMPQVAVQLVDLVIEMMDDLPKKDEIVARIRKINGQRSSEDDMTDEEKAQQAQQDQAAAQEQAAMKQLEMAMAQLQVALGKADLKNKTAQAMKATVEAQMKRLEGYLKAMEVAQTVGTTPELTGAADALIAESANPGGNGSTRQITAPEGGMS